MIGARVEVSGVKISGECAWVAGGEDRRSELVWIARGDVVLDKIGVSVEVLLHVNQATERGAGPRSIRQCAADDARTAQDEGVKGIPRLQGKGTQVGRILSVVEMSIVIAVKRVGSYSTSSRRGADKLSAA
jgi:hypothetical protein